MNKKLNIIIGVVGLIASFIIFFLAAKVGFLAFLFSGMAGDKSGAATATNLFGLTILVSVFLIWQFVRLIQSKTRINGFLLLLFLILEIVFIKIPFDALKFYDSVTNTVVPHSIFDYISK